jgi:integrase
LQEFSDVVRMDSMKLYKRSSNGIWYIRFARGKEKSLKTKDEAQAKRIFKKVQEEILKGRLIKLESEKSITLKEFKKEYIEHRTALKNAGSLASATVAADTLALQKLVDNVGGSKPLCLISRKAIDTFHTDLLNLGEQATSVNVHIRHLKAAFNKAVEWEYLKKSPYKGVKQLPVEDTIKPYLDTDEKFKKLFNAIEDAEFAVMVIWYLYLGCRRSMLVKLKWEYVLDKFVIFPNTKGKRPTILPIPQDLQDIIAAMERHEGYVFRWRGLSTITHMFKEVARAAGLDVHLHSLRHTTGSHLAIEGVPQKQIQGILDQKQLSTTDIYTHLAPEHLREAINKLDFAGKLQAVEDSKVISIDDKRTR